MAEFITKISTADGPLQIDYKSLANLPQADKNLKTEGAFADAKVVGDKISAINSIKINGTPLSQTTSLSLATADHKHSASDLGSHTHTSSDISGTIPMTKGGTGATSGSVGLKNLLDDGPMILKSGNQYGPESTMEYLKTSGLAVEGMIFFVKA